jgi:hypothetical protein
MNVRKILGERLLTRERLENIWRTSGERLDRIGEHFYT